MTNPTSFAPAKAGTPAYLDATAVYNLSSIPAPRYAVSARTSEDVAYALAFARETGIGIRISATGHASEAAAPYGDELLVRVQLDRALEIADDRRSARVPAGMTWGPVIEALEPYGLTALHGSSPDVGVVGYLLGGGASFYGRRYGVASNGLLSLELMTADGMVMEVTPDADPDLFWAVRGGGGGFGVVLSVVIPLITAPSVFSGIEFYSIEKLMPLLAAWDVWCKSAPVQASTSFRVMNIPSVPGFPDDLFDGPVVAVDGAVLDADEPAETTAGALLAALRAVAEPLHSTWKRGTAGDVLKIHLDPPEPLPYILESFITKSLGDDGIEAVTAAVEQTPSLIVAELRQLGGAFRIPDPNGGAVDHFDGEYIFMALAPAPDAAHHARSREDVEKIRSDLRPWDSDFTVPTFVGGYDRQQRSFDEITAQRVNAIRQRVDPLGTFASNVAPGSRVKTRQVSRLETDRTADHSVARLADSLDAPGLRVSTDLPASRN